MLGRRGRRIYFAALLAAIVAIVCLSAIAASDAVARELLLRTLQLAVVVAAVAVPLGAAAAWAIERASGWVLLISASLLAGGLLTPLYVQAGGWRTGLGVGGLASQTLGLPPLVEGWLGAVIVHAAAATPWCFLVVWASNRAVDARVLEAASLEASRFRVAWRIAVPLAAPALAVAALLAGVSAASEMTVTDLFRVRTYVEEVYMAFAGTGEVQTAGLRAAPGVLLVVLLCCVTMWGALQISARNAADAAPASRKQPRASANFVLVGVVAVTTFVPLAGLVARAGKVADSGGSRWSAAEAVLRVVQTPQNFGEELATTLVVGAAATLLAVVLGGAIAWGAFRWSQGWVAPAVAAIAWATPGPLVAVTLIWLLNRPSLAWWYDQTIAAPALAQAVRALAPAILLPYAAWRGVSPRLWEAARLDGTGTATTFLRIALPAAGPAFAAAAVIGFAFAAGDLAASLLVLPPGEVTFAARIFDRLHSGADAQSAGACLFAWLLAAGLAAAAIVWTSRWSSRGERIG